MTEPGLRSERLKPGGTIWHDLRRTFATRLRAHGVHEYDSQDLLGHSKPGVTKVYARATQSVLEAAVEKLLSHVVELDERRDKGSPASSTHLTIEGANLN